MTSLSRTVTAEARPSKPCSASSSVIRSRAGGCIGWVIVGRLPRVGWHLPREPAVARRFKPSRIYRTDDPLPSVVAVRAGPALLLHHQRPDDPGVGGRVPGQRPLRPGEPDRPVEGRGEGAGDAGERPGQQLGLYGDGLAGVEPEGVERPGAPRAGSVGGEV